MNAFFPPKSRYGFTEVLESLKRDQIFGMFERRCPRAHLCAFFHREGLNFLRQELSKPARAGCSLKSFALLEYDVYDPASLNRYDITQQDYETEYDSHD